MFSCNNPFLDIVIAARAAVISNKIIDLDHVGYTGRKDIYRIHTHLNPKQWIRQDFLRKNQKEEGMCVWLSMCLIMNERDPKLATAMYAKMNEIPFLFRWLKVQGQEIYHQGKKVRHQKELKEILSGDFNVDEFVVSRMSGLYLFASFFYNNQMKITFRMLKKKDKKQMKLTDLDGFKHREEGYFVVFLWAKNSKRADHCVGIDCYKNVIYDCESNCKMQLNKDALDICVGDEREFEQFGAIYELVYSK